MLARLAVGNIRKSIADFGIYFLTVVLGVAVFYAFNSMSQQRTVLAMTESQDKIFELLGTVIGGVSVFIACVLVFLVVYANRFLVKRRKREFGIYLMLGMTTGDIVRIVAIESLVTGAASLAAGLVLGFALSQGLLHLTSALFSADIASEGGLAFVFSADALVYTLVVFVAIFLIAAVVNAHEVSKARLIDLMTAARRTEAMALRSLPLSLALFVVSVAMIGVSYKLLLDNGLLDLSPRFGAATVLVCAGTVLFFWSLSGFLLRIVQSSKALYYRGLNMFALRQLNAKVNTTFATLSVVCLTLFLALTSVCGGIGIRNAVEGNLAQSTSYSATVRTAYYYWTSDGFEEAGLGAYGDYAAELGGDMAAGLAQSATAIGAGDLRALVENGAQVDFLIDDVDDPLTIGEVEQAAGIALTDVSGNGALNPDYASTPLQIARLSQVNAALALAGAEPVELAEGECALLVDSDVSKGFFEEVARRAPVIEVGGVRLAATQCVGRCIETTSFPTNTGALVVPDDAVPVDALTMGSLYDVQCASVDDERAFVAACEAIEASDDPQTWPITMTQGRQDVVEQSASLSTIVAYLAIYLGFVLTVACAAILAIQQLSEASDNARRYGMLRKLGAPDGMIDRALLLQVAVYFVFPLLLAVAHSACAMRVVADVVAVFGALDIGLMVAMCAGAFVAVYGVYFAVTYLAARRLTRE